MAHDPAAWADFRARFATLARRVLSRFPNLSVFEREEAEDQARHAVTMELLEGRFKPSGDAASVAFVRTVLVNAARDVWRRRRPTEPLDALLEDGPPPSSRAEIGAQLACVERVVQSWKPEDRFIFMLKLEGASTRAIVADVARVFGRHLSPSAVDVRIFRLRAALWLACRERRTGRP